MGTPLTMSFCQQEDGTRTFRPGAVFYVRAGVWAAKNSEQSPRRAVLSGNHSRLNARLLA